MGYTNFPNGVTSFGVPITGSANHNVCMGKIWFVDGTNGSDGNSGLLPTQAYKTIQKAITVQILKTSGLGDIIYIAPGSYAENLTGDLTRVALIGCPRDFPWHIVSIRPPTSYAWTGTMFEAMLKNLTILSAAATNPTYPALQITNMRYSVIEDCHFVGATATCVEAIQVGPTGEVTTDAHMDYCIIRRNRIDTWYGAASQFSHGIKIGKTGYQNGYAHHFCIGTTIEYNDINVSTYGIALAINGDLGDFSIIRGNVIDSAEAATGVSGEGIWVENSAKVMVIDNRISAASTSAILAGSTGRVLCNWCGENSVAIIEGPAMV